MLLTDLYVPPAWRGTGLGGVLVRKAVRYADDKGWDVWLYCSAHGRGPRMTDAQLEEFYNKHGFNVVRRHPDVEMVRRCAARKPA